MRYSGIQPQYFPRLHYFARILNADIFISRDDAQFLRKHKYPDGKTDKSYQAHSPIKTPSGPFLLNVPTKHNGFAPIYKTEVSYESSWTSDHLKAIKLNYSKSPNFPEVYKELEKLLSKEFKSLGDLNMATILWTVNFILGNEIKDNDMQNIKNTNILLEKQNIFRLKQINKATEMKATKDLEKFDSLTPNEKIVMLIKETGADEDYCGGTSVSAYIDHKIFKENGIRITVQDWKCKEFPQQFLKQQGFIPNLSIIDLLMNTERGEVQKILNG